MGLDVYLYNRGEFTIEQLNSDEEIGFDYMNHIEIDSATYPEHYFKIGYFRSSYNAGGYNRRAKHNGVPSLYDVFSPGEEYYVAPNWEKAKSLASESVAAWKMLIESDKPCVAAYSMSIFDFDSCPSAEAALVSFDTKWSQGESSQMFRAFSSREGEFMLDGLSVRALIPGRSILGTPCIWVIHDTDLNHYLQCAEIVKETVEWVLETGNPDQYVLSWSG